ncbi:MAG: hypothetical protein IT176_00925 [Acidobacteria bacterium]|nr:hypothetical protein [Acidobacteriota bacterium]
MRRVVLGLILAFSVAACAADAPSPPAAPSNPNASIAGTWIGELPYQGTTVRMTWTLSQAGANVSGPVLIGFATGTVLVNGVLTGTVSGSALTYTIAVGPGGIPLSPQCVGQLGGTMTASAGSVPTLAGTFALVSSTCTAPISGGAITLTRP